MISSQPSKPSVGDQPDARRAKRERTFLPARISFGEGALKADCVVTQLSPTGARINLAAAVALPDRFNIAIPQRGLACRAKLVWRKDDLAGLEFDQTESVAAPTTQDANERIRELEAANAKLRSQVAELMAQVQRLTDG
ncbi:MAG TPA: PilZ domain-containing protein [Roseiarcus sp.]|nr:PilZ domain-containing protein [Roseiarcus sp.]